MGLLWLPRDHGHYQRANCLSCPTRHGERRREAGDGGCQLSHGGSCPITEGLTAEKKEGVKMDGKMVFFKLIS